MPNGFDWDSLPDAPDAQAQPAFDFDSLPDVTPDQVSPERAFLDAYANSALMGYLPQVEAGLSRMMPDPNAALDEQLRAEGFKVQQADESYLSERDKATQRLTRGAQQNPKASLGGTLAGAATGALLPVGAAAKGATLGQKVLTGAKTGAIYGGLMNPGDEEGKFDPIQIEKRADNIVQGAIVSGSIPAILAAPRAIKLGGQKLSKKVFAGTFGVSEDAIDDYLARHDELKDIVDVKSGIQTLQDDIERATAPMGEKVRGAKDKLFQMKKSVAARKQEIMNEMPMARAALKEAKEGAVMETAPKVSNLVKRLSDDVSQGSGKAFEILDEAGAKVKTKKINDQFKVAIKDLKSRAVTDKQIQTLGLLERYQERIKGMGTEIDASEVKRIVQSIDEELADAWGQRMGTKDKYMAGIRRQLDRDLKKVPGYREQMAKVAKDTRMLKKLKGFQEEQGAINRLNMIDSLSKKGEKDLLRQLESRYGKEIISAVQQENLPQFSRLRQLMAEKSKLQKGAQVGVLEKQLKAAEDEIAAFKNLVVDEYGKSGTQAAIRSQLTPNQNLNTAKALEALDRSAGSNFSQRLADLKTVRAFDAEYTRGSANTNFWGLLGMVVGGTVAGPGGGIAGAGAGGAVGRLLIDRYGPQAARSILDGVAKLQKIKNPMVAIDTMKVSPAIKQALKKEYMYFVIGKQLQQHQERMGKK